MHVARVGEGLCASLEESIMIIDLGDWMSPGQAAHRLSLSRERIGQLIRAGVICAISTPIGRMVRRADIDELARQRQSAPALTMATA